MELTGQIYRTGVVVDDDYNKLNNKPSINGQELSGDIELNIPSHVSDLEDGGEYLKTETLNETLQSYAKKTEIPDVSDLATKQEIPDVSSFITAGDLPDLSGYALKTEIPDVSGKADKLDIERDYLKTDTYTNDKKSLTDEISILKEKIDGLINGDEVEY